MDNNTAAVIEKLADKLGTTADRLWAVLVHQAPISAAIDCVQYAALVALTYAFWRLCRHVRVKKYSNSEPLIWIAVSVAGIAVAVLDIVAFCAAANTATAFLNPEYWALKEVLSVVRR